MSTFTERLLRRLRDVGVRAGYSTSRSPEKAAALVGALPFSAPSVALNGAVILGPGGEVLLEHTVPHAIVEEAVAFGRAHGLSPFLLGREAGRDVLAHAPSLTELQRAFLAQRPGDRRLRSVGDLRPLASTYVVSFVVPRPSSALAEALAGHDWPEVTVSATDDVTLPGARTIELRSSRATKGVALREVMARLDLDPSSVIVFGDQENDLPLFEEAGLSVAVANAHPELARRADARCASNDDDGVARWLADRFGL